MGQAPLQMPSSSSGGDEELKERTLSSEEAVACSLSVVTWFQCKMNVLEN